MRLIHITRVREETGFDFGRMDLWPTIDLRTLTMIMYVLDGSNCNPRRYAKRLLRRGVSNEYQRLQTIITEFLPAPIEPHPIGGEPVKNIEVYGYELGGILGIDPRDFSIRQLVWMVEGRSRELWNHTARICMASNGTAFAKRMGYDIW